MIHFTLTRLDPTTPTWEAEAVCGNRRPRGYTNMPEWVTCKRCKRTRLYRVTLRLTRAVKAVRPS